MAVRSMRLQRNSIVVLVPFLFLILRGTAGAQQTVFNVPSADVLNRGQLYDELDVAYNHSGGSAGFTPRLVLGIGRRIEVGLNVNGLSTPADLQTVLSPAVKWKAYDGGSNGWAFLLGDDLFVPVQNRAYNAGNYFYAEFAKTWKTNTRATFGAYHFTSNTVANAQRAGGQFAIEQPINKRLTLAVDWFTGNHSLGYVTPGAVIKLAPKLTWYAAYQVGNSGSSDGNNQLLIEFGWNFN